MCTNAASSTSSTSAGTNTRAPTSSTTRLVGASGTVADKGDGSNAAAIGGAIGGVAAFILIVFGCLWWVRRKRRTSSSSIDTEVVVVHSPLPIAAPAALPTSSSALAEELRGHLEAPLSPEELQQEVAAFKALGGRVRSPQELGAGPSLDRASTFQGCGRMDRMSVLIDQLEHVEGCGIRENPKLTWLGELLKQAADQRLILGASETGQGGPAAILLVRYVLLCAKELRAMDAGEFDTAAELYCALRKLPDDWDVRRMLVSYGYSLLSKEPVAAELHDVFQRLLDDSFRAVKTRDRKGGLPKRLVLTAASDVKNAQGFVEYCARRSVIAEELDKSDEKPWNPGDILTMASVALQQLPELDATLNEVWLFHGCSEKAAEGITSTEFRLDLAGSGAGTLYGPGIYLAESCCKSDEYAGGPEVQRRFLLLCRAILGKINYTDQADNDAEQLVKSCLSGEFHSVLGDRAKCRGTYREFILYDNDQVYPAYILEYRQEF